MRSEREIENDQSKWLRLADGLPGTRRQICAEIAKDLKTSGYAHLKGRISTDDYEAVAGAIGTIILRSEVRIDQDQERLQEKFRLIKGRPGIYRPDALGFHSDPNADVVSWYCMEQDEIDGSMLLLDTNDIEQHFSQQELAILKQVELWVLARRSDNRQEKLALAPLLSKDDAGYRIYYAPWLLRDSYDSDSEEMIKKFSDYIKDKEQTQLIRLPIKKHESVFIDNHRMLHGRGAISENSKRHLVRFYLRLSGLSC